MIFSKALKPETKMIWVETPSNPLLKLVDLAMVAEAAKARGILSVADNTFASPWIQRPLEYGFDVVVHSATKYLNGHSDIISGVAVTSRERPRRKARLPAERRGLGAEPVRLLPRHARAEDARDLRMERHCENALAIAAVALEAPEDRARVLPGLASHPQHALALRQMAAGGGMVSAIVKGGKDAALRMLERCQIFTLAESLGGVESLIEHPAIMTHASVPAEVRDEIGISDALVRLSVGIEDLTDLEADLEQALA